MKRFHETRSPLTLLKQKLTIKASKDGKYKVFEDELTVIITEQGKFLEKLEFKMAEAEVLDGDEACSPHLHTNTYVYTCERRLAGPPALYSMLALTLICPSALRLRLTRRLRNCSRIWQSWKKEWVSM